MIWLMIAFASAPGFRPSRNGRSWVAFFETRDQAIAAKRRLTAAGIQFKCRKVERPGQAGRGKPRRQQVAAVRADLTKRKAMQIYEAGLIEGRKQSRLDRDAGKRKAELASQRRHRERAEQLRQAAAEERRLQELVRH